MANGTTNQQVGGNNNGDPKSGPKTTSDIKRTRETPQFLGAVRINKGKR